MKSKIKTWLFALFWLLALPFSLTFVLLTIVLDKDQTFASYSQLLSLVPGKVGIYLRSGFYRVAMSNFSSDALVSFSALFSQADTSIHSGVYIGPQCNIGKCSIGENTLIGSGVHVMSGKQQHNFADLEVPIKDQGGTYQKISIGENCWFGNGALVMANVGKNCIIGAGSVVTHDIPDNSIAAGNPAKVIKSR